MAKSYHQHKQEELEAAKNILHEIKKKEKDNAVIKLKDNRNTTIIVSRSRLKKKIAELKKQGKTIKQIL